MKKSECIIFEGEMGYVFTADCLYFSLRILVISPQNIANFTAEFVWDSSRFSRFEYPLSKFTSKTNIEPCISSDS